MKFKKILIANRGEMAVRILRTCRELGIDTVSIHSIEDEESLHVKLADESVCIGPAKASMSYLNELSILSAADITGADAIHPGVGFLSENADFSDLCEKWGVTFVGPKSDCIRMLGDKIRSKNLAKNAGLSVLETFEVSGKSEADVKAGVLELGFPVLIKASAGGGGRGMKRIDSMENLFPSLARLEEEAKSAFNDGTLFIEKYIERPRHIEVQILADKFGNVIHLGERDCTVQRRYQKIIEESPSPVLSDKVRNDILDAALKLSENVKYDSVGTVEFLYDMDTERFYFMEMNTRIQVEHPVTELRTGIDLIAEQIKVAADQKLSYAQKDITFQGHSMECRINAENDRGQPSPGKIGHYHRPSGIGVRVDDFIYSGYRVSSFYDSLLAKVLTYAPDRLGCIARMERALGEMVVSGISSNIELHKKILAHEDFISSDFNTSFLMSMSIK